MRNLTINIAGSFLIKILSLLLNLALIPLGMELLSEAMFSVWVVLYSLLTWFTFLDLGMGNSLRNLLLEALHKGRKDEARALVSTSYAGIALFTASAAILLLTAVPFIPWHRLFNVEVVFLDLLQKTMYLAIGLFAVQVLLKNISFIFHGIQLSFLGNLTVFAANLVTFLWLLIIRQDQSSITLDQFTLISLGSPIIMYSLASGILFFSRYRFLRPKITLVRKDLFRKLNSMGYKFFLIQFCTLIFIQGNSLIIAQLHHNEDVINYNASFRIFNTAVLAFTLMLAPIWSSYTKAFAKNDLAWIKKIHHRLLSLWMIAALGISVFLLLSPWFFEQWIGRLIHIPMIIHVANAAYSMVHILASIFTSMINSCSKITLQFYAFLGGSILFIPSVILIDHLFHHPSTIIFVNAGFLLCITLLFGVQCKKIMSGTAQGIWNR
jgi:O-antigen/teichoic acid export membrane protein